MNRAEVVTKINQTGIMAIVRVRTHARAKEIAQACLDGGVNILEISYTHANAGDIIAYLKEEFNHSPLIIGAGTVLDSETARHAILSGAQFVIAPNFKKEVALLCNRYQIPYAPGCTSTSEMVEALEYGASHIKVFPIAEYFGPSFIKTIKTPLPYAPLLSSGGVTLENCHTWFETGVECLGVGSLLTKGSYDDILTHARTLIEKRDLARSL
ncbi:hypothetical protein [Amphibacillus jilinensis]|uniref:hypothetical protein n=1 Tax=Amphibacillus jilinensis TaxID=1216008 RepID=UPI0002E54275|nr:hypothetical protein [Amphibacillus jilinensis]